MTTKPWRPVTLAPTVLVPLAAAPLTAGGTADAETSVTKIAHALRSSLVYVDRASGALGAGHARELAGSVRDTGVPIYVAVLPDDPAYGGEQIFDRLRAAVDRPGVHAVALGSSFGAAYDASVLPGHVSQAVAQQSLRRHHGDLPAVLDGFVADVAARTGGGGDHGVEGDRGSSGLSVGGAVVFLAVLAALGGGGLHLTGPGHKHRRERERADFEQVRGAVEEDITAYGEKRSHMGFDPSDPASTPDLVDYYGRALDAYETAKARSAAARRPENVRAVTEALEEGRCTLAVLDSRRRGLPLPSGVCRASSTRGTACRSGTSNGCQRAAAGGRSRHAPRTPRASTTAENRMPVPSPSAANGAPVGTPVQPTALGRVGTSAGTGRCCCSEHCWASP